MLLDIDVHGGAECRVITLRLAMNKAPIKKKKLGRDEWEK